MNREWLGMALAAALLGTSGVSVADHNSKNGEGTANMPNDIHNTRIETLQNGDSERFREFVKYGEGSTSVNRFATEETKAGPAAKQQARERQRIEKQDKQAQAKAKARQKQEARDMSRERKRLEKSDLGRERMSRFERSDRNRSATRSSGGRRGGRR